MFAITNEKKKKRTEKKRKRRIKTCRIKIAEIEYYNLVLFKLGSNLKLEDTKFKIQLLE